MKVLHLVDTFEARYERDQIQMVRMCLKKGFDTTVMTSTFDSDGNFKTRAYFREWDETFNPVTIIRPPSFKLRLPRLKPVLIYLLYPKLLDNYDLIHIYTIGSYCFFLGSFLKKIKHVRTVVRAEMSPQWHERVTKSWIWQKTVLSLLKKADAVYAFTEAEKERLLDAGIPEDKVFIVPVGINYTELSKVQKESKGPTVGYIGRFVPFKGSHRLVSPLSKLANEFPSVRIVFAGPKTVPDYADKIINSMTKLPNFEYLGTVSPAKEFYELVDIILVPSLDLGKSGAETGSITTLEAMACGKAVIASDISPMNEYIEHGFSGLLAKNDEEFYQYSKQLIEHPDLIETLAKNAREKAKQYDREEVFNRLEILYNSVISKAEGDAH